MKNPVFLNSEKKEFNQFKLSLDISVIICKEASGSCLKPVSISYGLRVMLLVSTLQTFYTMSYNFHLATGM